MAVKVESFQGRLRLRWSHKGKRHCLSLGLDDTDLGRALAQSRASLIDTEIAMGNFDPTLACYQSGTKKQHSTSISAVKLFEQFIVFKKRSITDRTAVKYTALAGKVSEFFRDRSAEIDEDTADGFRLALAKDLAPDTQKTYLILMKACWDWGLKKQLIAQSPWTEVLKRVKVPPKQRPNPFTADERAAILAGFRDSRYYSHYTDFVTFLFGTGCRTGEAIGLCWKHLSPDCNQVWIGESVSRGIRKATKTNKAREFRLSQRLQTMLVNRRPENWQPDGLVFPSPKGGPIDDHNFRNRAWVKVLRSVGVTYRKPYLTRHTFISHALAAGMKPMTVSEMTGAGIATATGRATDNSGNLESEI